MIPVSPFISFDCLTILLAAPYLQAGLNLTFVSRYPNKPQTIPFAASLFVAVVSAVLHCDVSLGPAA